MGTNQKHMQEQPTQNILATTAIEEPKQLCYISILHQTTTQLRHHGVAVWLCYISILHQTTTKLWPSE